MNIKSVFVAPVQPIDPKPKVDGNSRAKSSSDRDADGKRHQQEGETKRNLSQQEFDDAIKTLGETPGLKSNNLVIKVEVNDGVRVIYIVDPNGVTVRRLSESQLWSVTRDKDRQTGKFLDKAM